MPANQLDLDQAASRVEECEIAIAQQLQLIEELQRDNKRLGAAESILQALNLALLHLCETRDNIARVVEHDQDSRGALGRIAIHPHAPCRARSRIASIKARTAGIAARPAS